jgi:hypothetical protein
VGSGAGRTPCLRIDEEDLFSALEGNKPDAPDKDGWEAIRVDKSSLPPRLSAQIVSGARWLT